MPGNSEMRVLKNQNKKKNRTDFVQNQKLSYISEIFA